MKRTASAKQKAENDQTIHIKSNPMKYLSALETLVRGGFFFAVQQLSTFLRFLLRSTATSSKL